MIKKGQTPDISQLYRALPAGGIKTKIVESGDVAEIINRAKFYFDRSRDFGFTGGGGSKIACSHRKAESSLT
jgi:hypothetical protein